MGVTTKFQFHYGSIKMAEQRPEWKPPSLFQFHYGSIKMNVSANYSSKHNLVSIPLWFD